ncbi:MAG: 1,4-alpha-glucan branching protein GlgB [Gammaproteobacteria bacterium]
MKDSSNEAAISIGADARRILEARSHDPFGVLGRHPLDGAPGAGERWTVRAFLPHTQSVEIVETGARLERIPGTDLFEWTGDGSALPERYRLRRVTSWGDVREHYDPYCFTPVLDEAELDIFHRGEHARAHRFLGAHVTEVDGIAGVMFAVWAPNAERVSVVGEFNRWDGRCHPMRVRGRFGVWELFLPGLGASEVYKYEIRNAQTGSIHIKADPFAQQYEHRPSNASVVAASSKHVWTDDDWIAARQKSDWLHEPMSIYEMHLGSWRRHEDGRWMSFSEVADALVRHVTECGFTHVEFMPITEHPLDESWGYQTTGYFAPTARYGTADELKGLINRLHEHGIGVILDWVPGHFPRDEHGLARFDGSALFEYADTRKGEHADWGTLIFNYDRHEVRSFLFSSAVFWLEDFHFDGLRVDAVASMIYLDYSRKDGEWAPNVHGGNENLEAISFLQRMNEITHSEVPGSVTIAEESTAYPGVSRPVFTGGLGFSLKWNMGWMHDTLDYFSKDPVHRRYHHDLVTFGPVYAFSENFVLPFSHDEVVHGKGSILGRMPGDEWQRFANLRLIYTFQWTFPGKKLMFMGSEFGQSWEWNHSGALPWHLLDYPVHAGVQRLISDLNELYRREPALHLFDFEGRGFDWLQWEDSENSVLSFARHGEIEEVLIVLNLTPVPREGYRLGVNRPGVYREIFNSDSEHYGGGNVGNPLPLPSTPVAAMNREQSIEVTLPPLGGIVLQWKSS